MKKNGLNWLKLFFVAAAMITTGIIIYIFSSSLDDKFEMVLALSSVVVTLILGVITYYQTNEQTEIDKLDKTPYFRIVKDTEYEHHATDKDIDTNTLYQYTKFLRYSNYSDGIGAVVQLEFENVSNCIIKRVKKYVCANKKYSEGGTFVRYKDTQLVKMCYDNKGAGYEFHNNFNLNEREFDLIPNDKFEVSLIIADNIENTSQKEYSFSIALEIESVHGYVYTQYMDITVTPVQITAGCDWVRITDYDVDITPTRIKKKFLKNT